jgi:hypothetical protein
MLIIAAVVAVDGAIAVIAIITGGSSPADTGDQSRASPAT